MDGAGWVASGLGHPFCNDPSLMVETLGGGGWRTLHCVVAPVVMFGSHV